MSLTDDLNDKKNPDKSKFVAEEVELLESSCDTCVYRNKNNPAQCLAFPQGIPDEILVGKHDHKTPYPGDGGLTYEPE